MVGILRKADQRLTSEVAKKHGVSDQTIYAWRKRFGALEPADVKRRRSTSRKQAAEEDGGGSRSGDRRPQEDRASKLLVARVRLALCGTLDVGYVALLIARDAPVLRAMRTLAAQYTGTGTARFGSGPRDECRSHVSALAPGGTEVPKTRRADVATSRPRPPPPRPITSG